jgi:two-component system chemotaxis sensor kinase CheA
MDMSKYMDIFRAESEKYIKELSDSLLALETDPENAEQMNTLFRAAHTFKGMAATMGFKQIVELTHEMESLIDRLRTRQVVLDSSLIDVLFVCVDALEGFVENACKGEGNGPGKRKKDTEDTYESYPDISKVLRTLRDANQPPKKVSIQNSLQKDEDKFLSVKIRDNEEKESEEKESEEKESEEKESKMKDNEIRDNETEDGEHRDSKREDNESEDRKTENGEERNGEREESREKGGKIKDNERKCRREKEVSKIEETDEIKKTAKKIYQPEKEEKIPASPKSDTKVKTIQNSRISTEQLDKLMNLVGELVINRSRINELAGNLKSKELEVALSDFYKLTRELQDEVIEARMVPLDHITYIYPRMVRDLARVQNKKIDFIIKGKEIKLDRNILEEIGDSLVHLLRNAVDHGIEIPERRAELGKKETGTIMITASRQENFAVIKIEDDGCGIDTNEIRKVALKKGIISRESAEQLRERDAMQLIYTPGLSTSGNVTDISGRGIGMDVVKNRIERLGGSIKVESNPDLGSRFELKLPLTIAVYQAMLVRVGKEKYAIPFTSIVKNIEVSSPEIKHIRGQEAVLIDNEILPLLRLRRLFQLPDENENNTLDENNIFVVLVEKHGQYIGIVVDELLGKQEVIVKNFKSKLLDNTRGFAGATILGDGNVILIIDINSLI